MGERVLTVLGPIDPEEIGPTLMHEHVLVDLTCNFLHPEEPPPILHEPVGMAMLGLLRRRPFSVCLDNVILGDEALAIEEIRRFGEAGGSLLVDCTVVGIGRDPEASARVSRATGVHVVQGTGVYVEPSHPEWVAEATVDELAERFVRDVRLGIGDTGVRAGILGEIGTSGVSKHDPAGARVGDITEEEEKVLRAAGRACVETGAAVSVHLDVRGHGAFRIIDVLSEEGVAPGRMIMCHLDPVRDLDYHLEVGSRGVYLEYDCFGRDYYADEIGVSWGHDVQRIEFLCRMLDAGYEDQMMVSQDICMKIDLRAYGGCGYDHILVSVLPMLRRAGITERHIQKMLVENPRRALAFDVDG